MNKINLFVLSFYKKLKLINLTTNFKLSKVSIKINTCLFSKCLFGKCVRNNLIPNSNK